MLCLVMLLALTPSAHAQQQEQKVVRVGWFESFFNTTDKSGKRSDYAYEYQLKIASYTGWQYQYVTGSWPDLMQMLADGEIDLSEASVKNLDALSFNSSLYGHSSGVTTEDIKNKTVSLKLPRNLKKVEFNALRGIDPSLIKLP